MGRRIEPWRRGGALRRACLRVLEALYRLGWAALALARRSPLFRRGRVAVPVLSVGNLSVGGTGKSPLVRLLAGRALRAGLRPAVLSRGHGSRRGPRPLRVGVGRGGPGLEPAERCGDEAYEHARALRCPVWVDPDRLRGARAAVADGAGCVILDDGFQRRWQLGRDLDLLLADYGELLAGERLLPAGPFREPWSRARFADAVLVSGAPPGLGPGALRSRLPREWTRGPLFRLDREPLRLAAWPGGRGRPLSFLRRRRVLALSGLGRPEQFEAALEGLGAAVLPWRFADHHAFRGDELAAPPGAADCVVTTAKDAVRLPRSWDPGLPVLVLEAHARVRPGGAFGRLVDRALAGRRAAAGAAA